VKSNVNPLLRAVKSQLRNRAVYHAASRGFVDDLYRRRRGRHLVREVLEDTPLVFCAHRTQAFRMERKLHYYTMQRKKYKTSTPVRDNRRVLSVDPMRLSTKQPSQRRECLVLPFALPLELPQ
jgi:hypothetical protein